MWTRRDFLATAAAAAAPAARPNFVVLLADDMGWGDPSCYGNRAVETPHLDALARTGVRFENFYAASAVCSPSRAALLTGRYPLRFDIRKAFVDDEAHLPVSQSELPWLLKRAGYATGHVGKWHLGGLHQKHIRDRAHSIPGPHQHGFDHYQCQNEEQPLRRQMGTDRTLFRKGGTVLIRDEKNVAPEDPYYPQHFTDINGEESVRLIRQFHRAGKPFFLNTWFLAPHQPYEPAPEPFWEKAAAPGITDDQRRYRSMVMHLDAQVGKILRTLEELKLRENTLVVFLSDNGGAYEANIGPYKGGKTDLHEGGIRVTGIFSMPGQIGKGRVSKEVGHHCDILPTFCAAAGVAAPKGLDGTSLWDTLTRGKAIGQRTLCWQIDSYGRIQRHTPRPEPHATEATRQGDWKLLSRDGRPVALYDLANDPLESTNLIDRRADQVQALAAVNRSFLESPRDRSGFPVTAQ